MKRVLISGGSRGIGRAIVEKFSQHKEDFTVAFIYKSSDEAAAELSSRTSAYAIKSDLSTMNGAERAAAQAKKHLGAVDILINCAGISSVKPIYDIGNDELSKTLNVNLSASFILSRELSKDMVARKSGRIINIGSMWGARGASCEVHYSASKAGLRGLTLSLAKELGRSGITVNCVEPGFIMTDMNSAYDGALLDEIKDATPLSRLGTPEDVAELVFFLASDSASFITAQCIGVDGGIIL